MGEILDANLVPEEMVEIPEFAFATIGAVNSEGVTLIFDGQEEATDKVYKVNTSVVFSAGDRVKVHKDSGTYVVEYVVGSPAGDILIPLGGVDGNVLKKDGSIDYALKWGTVENPLPSGGSSNNILAKNSATDYDVKWMSYPIPTSGTDGQLLAKNGSTNYALKWVDAPDNYIPSGGTDGQLLAKNGTTNYALKWVSAPVNYIPSGGSDGQLLAKNGSGDYSLKYITAPVGLPTGGSSGQALVKSSSTNYAVTWGTPAVDKLTDSSNTLTLDTKTLTPSATGFVIGTSSYTVTLHTPMIRLYYSSYTYIDLKCNSSKKLTVNDTAIH